MSYYSAPPPRRPSKNRTLAVVLSIVGGVLALCVFCGVIGAALGGGSPSTRTTQAPGRPQARPDLAMSVAPSSPATSESVAAVPSPEITTAQAPAVPRATEPASVYYANCAAVRAAGAAPLHRGEPGYRKALDRDGDGTACDK